MTTGPATIIESVSTFDAGASFVIWTYVSPAKFGGVVHAPFANGVNALPPGKPPLVNEQKVPPVAVVESCTVAPATTAADALPVMVTAAKGVMSRLEPVGHEVMKPAARVKTERMPSGVSKAEGTAATFEAVRMKVWWRDSTVTIWAATDKMPADWMRGAAPRYLFYISFALVSFKW